jgi:hypothetical protein
MNVFILTIENYLQAFENYVLPLEIQLSRRDGWDTIKWFNTAILLCLSRAKTWVPNVICCCCC